MFKSPLTQSARALIGHQIPFIFKYPCLDRWVALAICFLPPSSTLVSCPQHHLSEADPPPNPLLLLFFIQNQKTHIGMMLRGVEFTRIQFCEKVIPSREQKGLEQKREAVLLIFIPAPSNNDRGGQLSKPLEIITARLEALNHGSPPTVFARDGIKKRGGDCGALMGRQAALNTT
ncbi:hypothetical protein CEXT_541401 [Caerostris extrusa]|uniref:Uncharacterized protein n=1 Tax=Caerostris extrusa TaxID=172846 RepID=A0AAV4XG50_CAEEX|nr:hypothetical protein CEXT_541401 [Caerostris extrusa]